MPSVSRPEPAHPACRVFWPAGVRRLRKLSRLVHLRAQFQPGSRRADPPGLSQPERQRLPVSRAQSSHSCGAQPCGSGGRPREASRASDDRRARLAHPTRAGVRETSALATPPCWPKFVICRLGHFRFTTPSGRRPVVIGRRFAATRKSGPWFPHNIAIRNPQLGGLGVP